MALPITIPNTFANATSSIPLSQLDNNFSTVVVAINGIGNGAEALANVNITGGTVANVTLSSSNVNITGGNVAVTTVDATNVEVTNIKAKDGTAAVVISDSSGNVNFDSNTLFVDATNNRVGVGTGSPSALLDVNGAAKSTSLSLNGVSIADYSLYNALVARVGNGAGIGINSANSSDNAYIYFGYGTTSGQQQGAAIGRIGGDVLGFFSSSTQRAQITSDGYFRMLSGTGGIQFNGDTAAANALDDYEEGTFTPAITYATPGTLSATYAQQYGRYTKIGRLVYVQIFIQLTAFSKGTASGQLRISGLPFTAVSQNDQCLIWNTYDTPLTTTAGVFPMAGIENSGTFVKLYEQGNNNTGNPNWPDPDAASQYKLNGCYET